MCMLGHTGKSYVLDVQTHSSQDTSGQQSGSMPSVGSTASRFIRAISGSVVDAMSSKFGSDAYSGSLSESENSQTGQSSESSGIDYGGVAALMEEGRSGLSVPSGSSESRSGSSIGDETSSEDIFYDASETFEDCSGFLGRSRSSSGSLNDSDLFYPDAFSSGSFERGDTSFTEETSSTDYGGVADLLENGRLAPGIYERAMSDFENALREHGVSTLEETVANNGGIDDATSEEIQGPGGCCGWFDDFSVSQAAKAGLVQLVSTSFTFGIKPWVEEGFKVALTPYCGEAVANVIAQQIGGAFVGAIHTPVGKTVGGVLNNWLSMTSYTPVGKPFLNEIATIDVPVMAAFTATYTARGGIVPADAGHAVQAASKMLASMAGGLLQGAITDVLKQTVAKDSFTQVPPAAEPEFTRELFEESFKSGLNATMEDAEKFGHNLAGKILGSVVGNVTAPLWGNLELGGPATGALGMMTYLTGWFGGIHGVAELMKARDETAPLPGHVTIV